MKRVQQLTTTDCGLACVAMVTGRPYDEIRKTALRLIKFKRKYFYCTTDDNLRTLLKHYDIELGDKEEYSEWNNIPKFCIAGVNLRRKNWHWVVVKNKTIYDPSPHRTALNKVHETPHIIYFTYSIHA